METVFSTHEVHVRDRFDYWHDVACRSIVNHDSRPECRLKFNAAIQAGALADVGLIVFENSPMDISRTPSQAAHATNDEIFVCRQLAGSLALEQNGRRVFLKPGDFTLIDPLLPYVGRFFCGSNLLVLKVPRRALEARVGKTREMVARDITACSAEASLTSSFLAMLPSHAGRMRPAVEQIIRDQVLDLVAASLTKCDGDRQGKIFICSLSCPDECARRDRDATVRSRLSTPPQWPPPPESACGTPMLCLHERAPRSCASFRLGDWSAADWHLKTHCSRIGH